MEGLAARQSQVTEQFESVDRAIKRCEEIIAQVEGRLLPVLRNDPVAKVVDPLSKPESMLVPVAARLRGIAGTINGLCDRLDSVVQRTEC